MGICKPCSRLSPRLRLGFLASTERTATKTKTSTENRAICKRKEYLSRDMTKPTKWLCAQRRLMASCPGHPPSLIRVFAVRTKKTWVLSYLLSAQRRLWSDWADAQADLSLRWAHTHFVWFVTRRLILQINGHYYTLRHSLTEIQPCGNVHVQCIQVC